MPQSFQDYSTGERIHKSGAGPSASSNTQKLTECIGDLSIEGKITKLLEENIEVFDIRFGDWLLNLIPMDKQ